MLNRSKLWMNISASRVVTRRGLGRPASWVKVLLTGQLSSSPRCGPERTVTAGLGRCVAGDRSVPSFTQCRGSLHRDSHTFYIGNPNELLNPQFWKITVKTVDTNHEEAMKSGGESPAGLGLTLGFSAQRGILTRLLSTNLVSSSIVRRWW